MEVHAIQQQFFQYLKENMPPHLSMVDELCDILSLSHDSVYRRIRGEKPMSFSELKHFVNTTIFHRPGAATAKQHVLSRRLNSTTRVTGIFRIPAGRIKAMQVLQFVQEQENVLFL
jgi:hypothetical protein